MLVEKLIVGPLIAFHFWSEVGPAAIRLAQSLAPGQQLASAALQQPLCVRQASS